MKKKEEERKKKAEERRKLEEESGEFPKEEEVKKIKFVMPPPPEKKVPELTPEELAKIEEEKRIKAEIKKKKDMEIKKRTQRALDRLRGINKLAGKKSEKNITEQLDIEEKEKEEKEKKEREEKERIEREEKEREEKERQEKEKIDKMIEKSRALNGKKSSDLSNDNDPKIALMAKMMGGKIIGAPKPKKEVNDEDLNIEVDRETQNEIIMSKPRDATRKKPKKIVFKGEADKEIGNEEYLEYLRKYGNEG